METVGKSAAIYKKDDELVIAVQMCAACLFLIRPKIARFFAPNFQNKKIIPKKCRLEYFFYTRAWRQTDKNNPKSILTERQTITQTVVVWGGS